MKMRKKHDLLAAIRSKEQEHQGQSLRLQWRTSRGRYNGGAFKNSNRHNDVLHYR